MNSKSKMVNAVCQYMSLLGSSGTTDPTIAQLNTAWRKADEACDAFLRDVTRVHTKTASTVKFWSDLIGGLQQNLRYLYEFHDIFPTTSCDTVLDVENLMIEHFGCERCSS